MHNYQSKSVGSSHVFPRLMQKLGLVPSAFEKETCSYPAELADDWSRLAYFTQKGHSHHTKAWLASMVCLGVWVPLSCHYAIAVKGTKCDDLNRRDAVMCMQVHRGS
jgi:hypothetical protein